MDQIEKESKAKGNATAKAQKDAALAKKQNGGNAAPPTSEWPVDIQK